MTPKVHTGAQGATALYLSAYAGGVQKDKGGAAPSAPSEEASRAPVEAPW